MINYFSTFLLAIITTTVMAFSAPNKSVIVALVMDNESDQEVITTIHTSLVTAERVAKVLNIEMYSSDEVDGDVFIFALKSEEQKNLTLQMFDEEGFTTAANSLSVNNGNNYNAVNVKSMENGTYIFKLTDDSGAEYSKRITIDRN